MKISKDVLRFISTFLSSPIDKIILSRCCKGFHYWLNEFIDVNKWNGYYKNKAFIEAVKNDHPDLIAYFMPKKYEQFSIRTWQKIAKYAANTTANPFLNFPNHEYSKKNIFQLIQGAATNGQRTRVAVIQSKTENLEVYPYYSGVVAQEHAIYGAAKGGHEDFAKNIISMMESCMICGVIGFKIAHKTSKSFVNFLISCGYIGSTLLDGIAARGDMAWIKSCLSNRLDYNFVSSINCAAANGHREIVEILKSEYEDLYQGLPSSEAFVWASKQGNLAAVKYVLSYFTTTPQQIDINDAFVAAAKGGHQDLIDFFLPKIVPTKRYLKKLIKILVEKGNKKLMNYIISKGIINAKLQCYLQKLLCKLNGETIEPKKPKKKEKEKKKKPKKKKKKKKKKS